MSHHAVDFTDVSGDEVFGDQQGYGDANPQNSYAPPPVKQRNISQPPPPISNPVQHPPPAQQQQQSQSNDSFANVQSMAYNFGSQNQFLQQAAMQGLSQIAQPQFAQATDTVQKMVNVGELRYYFKVDNKYVAKKLQLILFPFFYKEWQRLNKDDGQPAPPRDCASSPDLYIPVMALITFILTHGIYLGASGDFTPEMLAYTTSSVFGWLALELVFYRAVAFFTNSKFQSFYEFTAYSLYRYVPSILIVIISLIIGSSTITMGVCAYLCLALVFFTFNSLTAGMGMQDMTSKQNLLALIVTVMQVLLTAWVCFQHPALGDDLPVLTSDDD